MYKSNIVMAWRKTNRGNYIIGSKCKECHALFFPSRTRCTKCESNKLEDYIFNGNGKIFAHSTVFYPPAGLEKQVPYTVAIIKLDEGPKMTAQVVEFDDLKVGMKVQSCVRELYSDGKSGIIHYGIKFRPSD